jgi:hypothetical protein
MARYYVVREHARPFLASIPTFIEGDGAEADDRVEGDRWTDDMDRAQRFKRRAETVDGVVVLGAEEWAELLGDVAARDQRDPPEAIAAPTREDRARWARKAHGDGARKARREAEEKEAREAGAKTPVAIDVRDAKAEARAKRQATIDAGEILADAARPDPSFIGST